MEWMTWEEAAAFWEARLSSLPEEAKASALLKEGIRYNRGEARMSLVETSRWADDGGMVST